MKSENILDHYGQRNKAFLHGGGKKATEQLITLMALKGTEKVLEIGFGTGGTQVRLKSKFPKLDLFGIERSEVMLRKAKSRLRWAMLPSNQLFIDDGKNQHYPFPSMVFDVVFFESVFGILSMDEIKRNLAKVRRILKPGGKLVLNESIWLSDIPREKIRDINNQVKADFGIVLAHEELITIQHWKEFLSTEGFDIQSVQNVMPTYKYQGYGLRDILSLTYSYFGKIMTGFSRQTKKFNRLTKFSRQSLMAPGKQYIDAYLLMAKVKHK